MSPSQRIPAIGIDLGGTKTEVILLSSEDAVLFRERKATPRLDGYNAIVNSVAEMIGRAAGHLPSGSPYTVGIGIPGSLDETTGLVRNANSTCLIGQPLQTDIEKLINRSVRMRNDADCFTMAECHAGAGKRYGPLTAFLMILAAVLEGLFPFSARRHRTFAVALQ